LEKHGIAFNFETDDDEISSKGFKGAKHKVFVNYIKFGSEQGFN
jgi:hypothetical protein